MTDRLFDELSDMGRGMDSPSVTTWIGQFKSGESAAAQELWERYFQRLLQLARKKLAGTSRAVSDEEDVALSAFHSFCQAATAGRFPRLDNRDDLWQLLIMHTARKAINLRRYQSRQKRRGTVSDLPVEEVVGEEPTPAFAAAVADGFERLMEVLDEEALRQVALLKLQGFTNREIAEEIGCSPRTVDRKLTVIRGLWEEATEETDGA